ncbi:MAG: hypothetical protein AVDCRST_MAG39-485 [uncultured Sphingomonadaceae bacterium]|uniref:Peptidyl-prolyl cis-trans isomerase n=1 Tax=uncultured Sphingomonadaceae bacterium TaxID=169976 RepID=A0A6J4S9U6_9SPHN|nr:MAG: hypothetical protein AVDCRST_MAG39-485 [uncultured Sphingomonadaceae bacterium]
MRRGAVTRLWVGLGFLSLLGAGLAYAGTTRDAVAAASPQAFLASNARADGVVTTTSGLQYRVVRQGRGAKATPADLALVNYRGKLLDGTVFDETPAGQRGTPMPVGGLIPGFVEALTLMSPGAKYEIWIPPQLAYGPEGTPGGPIPGDAVLNFDVELVEVAPGAAAQGMFGPPPGGGGLPPGM